MTTGINPEYQGSQFRVVHCVGALDSYCEALKHVPGKKKGSMTSSLVRLIERLAEGHRMSNENFPKEGELPKTYGVKNGHFHAFKQIPIRAYVWRSKKHRNTYFISHYVYKDYARLDSADTNTVGNNWKRIEVGSDER